MAGVKFGIDSASPSVRVGGDDCASTSWVASSAVLCTSAASAAFTNGDVQLEIGDFYNTMTSAYTFDGAN